nr:hypothetical protein [Porphyromonas gulae]
MARKLFTFGSGSEKNTRQNEKNLAPLLEKLQTAIGAFPVRKTKTTALWILIHRVDSQALMLSTSGAASN